MTLTPSSNPYNNDHDEIAFRYNKFIFLRRVHYCIMPVLIVALTD